MTRVRLQLLAAVSLQLAWVPALAAGRRQVVIPLDHCLGVGPVGRYGRAPFHRDPIELQLVTGTFQTPQAGATITAADGVTRAWKALSAGKDGWIQDPSLRNGYAYFIFRSERDQVMLLDAAGDSMVYVNGAPRAGDPYANGIVTLPVTMRRGENELLFLCSGRIHASLSVPRHDAALNPRDVTVSDWIQGDRTGPWASVVVINASESPRRDLSIEAGLPGGRPVSTAVPVIGPLTIRKVAFRLPPAPQHVGDSVVNLSLRTSGRRAPALDTAQIHMKVVRPGDTYRRTFFSHIDGSLQYYAVVPPSDSPAPPARPALFLTLHGAGVEALGQALAYAPKSWGYIVAPTNRRPFGFDWEDWGRIDALEVLDDAQKALHTEPALTYLTGHSMGGHGAWQLGVTYPDRFAAVGPSAGWISFWSYAGARRTSQPTPVEQLIQRAADPSDTMALDHNLTAEGVYVLQGGADDNVPPTEARTMVAALSTFDHDYVYHEQPGVGHWWDISHEPRGVDCVDWPPMFDLFARHRIPADGEVRDIDFTTACPGISSRCHWVRIGSQLHSLAFSNVRIHYDPVLHRFSGTTTNVARLGLALDRAPAGAHVTADIDGQTIDIPRWPDTGTDVWLAGDGRTWAIAGAPSPEFKSAQRYGPFKAAFDHNVILVYGTRGTPEENRAAYDKARFDAETFWYRGNGSVDVVPDTAFSPDREHSRSVILYGNSETNGAWRGLLGDSPVQVDRQEVRIGDQVERGADLACIFVRPRPRSEAACVGVVAGTGLVGMCLADRIPYFVSGIAYPDCTVMAPETLSSGYGGVRAAGFFGPNWSVRAGDFAYQQPVKP